MTGAAEKMSDAEDAAKLIGELHAKLTGWDVDELQDALHHLDCARAEAICAAGRLRDRLPRERPYLSSKVL